MKEKLIAWMNSRRYNSHLMRLLVGGYIVYLGVKIMKNQADEGSFSPALSVCAVILILLGLPVALISLYAVYNGYSEEYKGKIDLRRKKEEDTPSDKSSQE